MPYTDFNSIDPVSYPSKTLLQMRTALLRRMGYGSVAASPPPGIAELYNDFLDNAQQYLFYKYDVFRMDRFYSWTLVPGQRFYDLTKNQELGVLPAPAAPSLGPPPDGSSGSLNAGTYGYRITAFNGYGETTPSPEATITATSGGKSFAIAWAAMPDATGYKVYGRTPAGELLMATLGNVLTWTDDGTVTPAGALPTVNTMVQSPTQVDSRKIAFVGIQSQTRWYELVCGIPPTAYNLTAVGLPIRYEIRQCLEVWPPPSTADTLWVKGQFGLLPFAADGDTTSIDWQPIFSYALFLAKAHDGQQDAQIYGDQGAGMTATYIGNLVAGSHHTKRYIPGKPLPYERGRSGLIDPIDGVYNEAGNLELLG